LPSRNDNGGRQQRADRVAYVSADLLMAAGNEDDFLDLISSIEEANGPPSPLTG